MEATQILHERGQSLWLDNITRGLLDSGQLRHYIDKYAVTGLTSNPSIFDKAIETGDYDDAIREQSGTGLSDEELFLELAIEDLRRAADAFLPVHERTDGVDGWVSLEVSPLLAHDTAATVEAAKALHARVARRNLFIKIPGTAEGLPAITECVASGVPVNVTLLFSADQYQAAADAYLAGVERRLESLGAEVSLRRAGDGSLFRTDQGNLILDADFGPIDDPATLAGRLLARAGVEHRSNHDKEQG